MQLRLCTGNFVSLKFIFATFFLKTIIQILCKVDSEEISKIPLTGPGVIMINHVNFLEVPLIQVYMVPRKMRGLVKKETWKNPFLRYFLNIYNAIPINRGAVNKETFKETYNALKAGNFICIAPEGTRSTNGILRKGKSGITAIALKGDAPIYPVVHTGGEKIWNNIKHFKRTKITLKVGKPFQIKKINRINRTVRDQITHEIMYHMAELLPEDKRGFYSDFSKNQLIHLIIQE